MLIAQIDKGYDYTEDDYQITTYQEDGEEYTVRISNPDAESGMIEDLTPGLSWLNSARITADPDKDAVYLNVSVGDPRGAFSFAVRRTSTGEIFIESPTPDDGMPHMETKQRAPGQLVIVHDNGEPIIFKDEPRYWIVFIDETTASWQPRLSVDIYDDPSEVYEDSERRPKDLIMGYISLGEVSLQQAEKSLADIEEIVEQWEDGEIDLGDIPDIEY